MLKIYGGDRSSPSNKVRFTANVLGLQYEYIKVNLRAGEHRQPEFLKINPAGKIPAIDDGGFYLFESNAIIRYLADKNNSALYPKGLKERAIVDEWIDFGSMHVGAAMSKVTYNRLYAPSRGESVDERSIQDGLAFLGRFLPVVDDQLGKNKYVTGPTMTLADLNMLALLDPAEASEVDVSKYKNIVRWRNALKKEAFYTKCHKDYLDTVKDIMAGLKK
ncbi:MAG: hypothetical protein A2Z88_07305 [Omnitrophica WOR_2 bacterium GWA2_47_8]|nr:MAG: hypothetical protein A2Z88_07305 [Omnitrophica WOR_2 bacterium GWA2_47_8]